MTDIGIPARMCADCAGEYISSKEFLAELKEYLIRINYSEPHHQHQNLAEGIVKAVKELVEKIISLSGAPENRWCYAVEPAEFLLNLRALEQLGWKNAVQYTLGETWDLSPAYQFSFWQKVSYTNPNVSFPKGKHHPGRWVGISHNVGDLLTYKVEKDNER